MADQSDDSGDGAADSAVGEKQSKNRPIKYLPTDRLSHEKQLGVLRGYVAASGPERKSVNNNDVAKVVGIHSGSISNCNPFFVEAGLLVRDGLKNKPADEVVAYASSYQWDQEKAAIKLQPIIRATWFAATLLPKLSFRAFSKDEAVTYLAEDAKATPEYKPQLELLLEYLKVAGLISIDGNMVSAIQGERPGIQHAQVSKDIPPAKPHVIAAPAHDTEHFSIPIPGKASATITFPKGLEAEDWDMLKAMLDAYIRRLRKESLQATAGKSGEGSQ